MAQQVATLRPICRGAGTPSCRRGRATLYLNGSRASRLQGPRVEQGFPTARGRAVSNLLRSRLVVADRDTGITAQLAGEVAHSVPLHLPLVDGEEIAVTGGGDDVAFPGGLFDVRSGDRNVGVIRVILLGFLFDDRAASEGRAESERANGCTQY